MPAPTVRHVAIVGIQSFSCGLADFLTGVYPDRMEARTEGDTAEIKLILSG